MFRGRLMLPLLLASEVGAPRESVLRGHPNNVPVSCRARCPERSGLHMGRGLPSDLPVLQRRGGIPAQSIAVQL